MFTCSRTPSSARAESLPSRAILLSSPLLGMEPWTEKLCTISPGGRRGIAHPTRANKRAPPGVPEHRALPTCARSPVCTARDTCLRAATNSGRLQQGGHALSFRRAGVRRRRVNIWTTPFPRHFARWRGGRQARRRTLGRAERRGIKVAGTKQRTLRQA